MGRTVPCFAELLYDNAGEELGFRDGLSEEVNSLLKLKTNKLTN